MEKKIRELKIDEIEAVVGGIKLTASVNALKVPTATALTSSVTKVTATSTVSAARFASLI
jgi:hypothetical protein